jgi:cyclophilin family peptidyl-prolyl cis-trans isomerase
MKRRFLLTFMALFAALSLSACNASTAPKGTQIEIDTNYGKIQAVLFEDKAPQTVKNFLSYVDSGFYNGTVFHRVIPNFMIQGGGFDLSMQQKATAAPIQNEADNGLKNLTGTLAMARTGDPHSATSQFFINVKHNDFLDFREKHSGQSWGYAVFGQVTQGMEVVMRIAKAKTTQMNGMRDVPESAVLIKSIKRL